MLLQYLEPALLIIIAGAALRMSRGVGTVNTKLDTLISTVEKHDAMLIEHERDIAVLNATRKAYGTVQSAQS